MTCVECLHRLISCEDNDVILSVLYKGLRLYNHEGMFTFVLVPVLSVHALRVPIITMTNLI